MTINTSPTQLRELVAQWNCSLSLDFDTGNSIAEALLAVAAEKEAHADLVNRLIMDAQERGFREGLKKGANEGAAAVRDLVLKNIFGA